MPCKNLYPTIACVVCKNSNSKRNTIAKYAMKKFGIGYQGVLFPFYCVFVRTEMNLFVFSDPSNCVNIQYTALAGARLSSWMF